MTCTATIHEGMITLPQGLNVPDGVEVKVIIPDAAMEEPSFADRYAAYIGAADDLPADLAENLDHYLHGHPKR